MSESKHGVANVMTHDEMERLLKKCSCGRLGLSFQNENYIVPVTYKYGQGRVYFHSARQGKKVDFIKNNNRVCFEVDELQGDLGWATVICSGTVTLREDIEAKKEFSEVFLGQKPSDELLKRMESYIGIVQIEDMTGRCSSDFSF
jgi:hypothetical protein